MKADQCLWVKVSSAKAIAGKSGPSLAGVAATRRNPTFHGEMDAINDYVRQHGNQGWEGLTLYTTGEPCPMCMGAIAWAGIGGVVFGSSIGTLSREGIRQIEISAASVSRAAPVLPRIPARGRARQRDRPSIRQPDPRLRRVRPPAAVGSVSSARPDAIVLLPLPAYSPELNPVENVWEYLRANFLSLCVWDTYEAILDACQSAWNKLMQMPERTASIIRRAWAKPVTG